MSMLTRYQKSGGFNQLLQLIETCGKQKQDNFLQIIEQENMAWAQAIREKMLTIEKVFSWDATVIAEIAGRLQQLTIATAMHGLPTESTQCLLSTFSHSQRRNIDDMYNSKKPTPAEVTSAYLKILQEVRNMIKNNEIRVEKFAPEMVISKDIEQELGQSSPASSASAEVSIPDLSGFGSTQPSPTESSIGPGDSEVAAMRKRIQALTTENTQMKTELRVLRDKLTQVRKIAA